MRSGLSLLRIRFSTSSKSPDALSGDPRISYAVLFGSTARDTAHDPKSKFWNWADKLGVEAEFEGSTVYPVRGKSCSTQAMPFLGEKFATFRDFALAPLEEIYPRKRLESEFRSQSRTKPVPAARPPPPAACAAAAPP